VKVLSCAGLLVLSDMLAPFVEVAGRRLSGEDKYSILVFT